jgi:hypothetical protein
MLHRFGRIPAGLRPCVIHNSGWNENREFGKGWIRFCSRFRCKNSHSLSDDRSFVFFLAAATNAQAAASRQSERANQHRGQYA